MKKSIILKKACKNLLQHIVACIVKVYDEDLPQYTGEYRTTTKNAIPNLVGDFINANISNTISKDYMIKDFKRYSWHGKVIIDFKEKSTYCIMLSKRLKEVRKQRKKRPHYIQTEVSVLNSEYIAPVSQLSFFDQKVNLDFDKDVLNEDFDSIFSGVIRSNEGYTHFVISYERENWRLLNIKILLLDKNLDIVEEFSLNDYIKMDYANLSDISEITELAEIKSSDDLIKIKCASKVQDVSENVDTNAVSTRLREREKNA